MIGGIHDQIFDLQHLMVALAEINADTRTRTQSVKREESMVS